MDGAWGAFTALVLHEQLTCLKGETLGDEDPSHRSSGLERWYLQCQIRVRISFVVKI